jgi:PBSX family phage portal protein
MDNASETIDQVLTFDDLIIPDMERLRKDSTQHEDPFQEQVEEADCRTMPYAPMALLELYEESLWHYRCCNIKSQVTTGQGWSLQPIEGEQEPDEQHKRAMEFLEAPNERSDETIYDILHKLWIDYEVIGNAYLEIDYNRKGEPANIYHMPAIFTRKSVERPGYYMREDSSAELIYFNAFKRDMEMLGSDFDSNVNTVYHIRNYYPGSNFYGIPDILPAIGAAVLNKYACNYNIHYFLNGAIPSVVITLQGAKLSAESQKAVQSFFKKNMQGIINNSRVLVIPVQSSDAKINIEKLSDDVKEGSFSKLREDNRNEIVAVHGVPPRLLGINEQGKLGGSNETAAQMRMFKEVVIEHRQRRVEHLVNQLLKQLGVENWRFTLNRLDIGEPAELAERVTKLVQAKVLLVNEGRAELGKDPLTPEEIAAERELQLTDPEQAAQIRQQAEEELEDE